MMPNRIQVNCPICGKTTTYSTENPYRPFCSERCKLIDLGAWAEDKYCITENTKSDDTFDSAKPQSGLNDF